MNPDHSEYESSFQAVKTFKYILVLITLQTLRAMLGTYRVLFIW